MKLEHIHCDFCGHEIKDGEPRAEFRVPDLPDGTSVDGTALKKKRRSVDDDFQEFTKALFASSPFGFGSTKSDARTSYDVCMGCARSFLVARFAAVKKAYEIARQRHVDGLKAMASIVGGA